MATRAHHRIVRTRYSVMAFVTVVILAVVLYVKVGSNASAAVLQAFGIVSLTILVGAFIFEKWIWKTKIGKLVGCPPNYSGAWEGTIERVISEKNEFDKIRIEVEITQNLLEIEWYQKGFDSEGKLISESHFLFGEVVDNQRKWGSICGMYEVTRTNKGYLKHYGSHLVAVSQDEKTMHGSYCSTVGNVGNIDLRKV